MRFIERLQKNQFLRKIELVIEAMVVVHGKNGISVEIGKMARIEMELMT
jgi:hypothetical protein